jgi:NADH-quinone oxidoreductase subunit D
MLGLGHLLCTLLPNGKSCTPFLKNLTGARFTTSYTRIGGVARDIPDGWLPKVSKFCRRAYQRQSTRWKNSSPVTVFLSTEPKGIGDHIQRGRDLALWYDWAQTDEHLVVDLDLRKDKPYSWV